MAGEEVVQLYVKAPGAEAPVRSLEGFQRVTLRPGEKKTVRFVLSARQLATVQADGRRMAEPGTWVIAVGGKQPGFQSPLDAATTGVVTASVKVAGAAKVIE